MKAYDLIQVLWVEDDPKVTETYPVKAENFGLKLVLHSCWDDAKLALENDYDRWSAIILDAKCKHHHNSADNAVKFLGEALADIRGLSKEKGRIIPWYVLTGGDESEVSDSINDDRLNWDKEWTDKENKTYYSKNGDDVKLYDRIREHAKQTPRIQISGMYRNAFRQLSLLNEEICGYVYTVLEAMHYPHLHQNFTPNLFYNPMRKALEYVFRTMQEHGIIPDAFFSNGKVNLNQCFMFLIGKDAEHIGYRYGNPGERIAPRHIQDMMSLIINLGNFSSHSIIENHETELSDEEMQKYDNYMKEIGGDSKMLIFSIALQFCEIVQWMKHYIERNKDKEKNLQKWVELGKTYIVERDKDGLYYAGEYLLNYDKIRWKGRKIKIIASCDNNKENKNIYPYFAYDFKVIEEPKSNSNW